MLVTNQQSAKLPEPSIGSFQNPSAFVAAELAAIFIAPQFVVLPIRCNQFDPSFLESLAQRIGVVAAVGYDAFRLLLLTTALSRTRTSATVASANLTSLGEALSSRTPIGRP